MIFMINEENCENIIKQAYRPQFDGRLVSVTYDIKKTDSQVSSSKEMVHPLP